MPALTTAAARQQIVELLDDNVHYALGLKTALENERAALEKQDVDAIAAVVDHKSSYIERLQVLDRRRDDLCQVLGFASGPDQMQQLINWCDDNEQIGNQWQQLMNIAAESRAINMTNGAIIRARQHQFEASLSVLRGVMPGLETYGRQGAESHDYSCRTIARA
jgi:flagellar biosynthesis/type III secretory pathway chaperone